VHSDIAHAFVAEAIGHHEEYFVAGLPQGHTFPVEDPPVVPSMRGGEMDDTRF
jgi:hypothetical protein